MSQIQNYGELEKSLPQEKHVSLKNDRRKEKINIYLLFTVGTQAIADFTDKKLSPRNINYIVYS